MTDVLIVVEDHGAANFVSGLPAALRARGIESELLGGIRVLNYLRECGSPAEVVPDTASPADLLARTSPKLLIVGTSENPDALGLALLTEARKGAIESIAVVDAYMNAEHRFRGRGHSPMGSAPDWLLVPDEHVREAYVRLGYPGERVVISGNPRFEYVRAVADRLERQGRTILRHSLLPEATDSQSVVVFVAEISGGLADRQYRRSPGYTLVGRGASAGRTEIILEELLDALKPMVPRPYTVLRLHPKNTKEEFEHYLGEIDLVSCGTDALPLVYVADLVVGMTSSLVAEAAIMGCATLSILPRKTEQVWLPSIRWGATRCATTRGEVRAALKMLLQPERRPEPFPAGEFSHIAGSLHRVSAFVEQRLANLIASQPPRN